MFVRASLFLTVAMAIALSLAWVGCSNETKTTTYTDSSTPIGGLAYYFPVNEGSTATYQVVHADGSTELITHRIDAQTEINSSPARIWLTIIGKGSPDTSYTVSTDSAVYVYDNTRSIPEQVLHLPLRPGSSWERYSYGNIGTGFSDNGGTNDGSGQTGSDTVKYPVDTNGSGFNSKVIPTDGSNVLTIDRVETLVLSNGDVYAGALRVSNSMNTSGVNHYWYVPGIGLTKYVVGASDSYPNGQTMGELVAYHK